MISVQALNKEGIVIVEPSGPLEEADFARLSREVETISNSIGHLNGLIIHSKSFPGWDTVGAFVQHMRFVKEHHKQIERIAVVTDSRLGDIGPVIAKHLVSAELRHFPFNGMAEAKEWITKRSNQAL